ncbi:MAG TPA: hypothetical protein VHN98_13270 [Acidimicrobiales bacterium]|nr:hypothetical protein [Acidimicrobiales bacterium]
MAWSRERGGRRDTADDDTADDDTTDRLTADDVAFLNRETMRDAAARARLVAVVLMIVAMVGLAAWLWLTVRGQQHAGATSFGIGGPAEGQGVAAARRLDVAASTMGMLVTSSFTFGVGAMLWLVASHVTVAYGGTLSGFEEGDGVTGGVAEVAE